LNQNGVADAVKGDQGYDVSSTEGAMKLSKQPAAQEGSSEKTKVLSDIDSEKKDLLFTSISNARKPMRYII